MIYLSVFYPDFFFDKVWNISTDFLKENNIKLVLLDVDNTLTTHDNPIPREEVLEWISSVKATEIVPIIISNNTELRVLPFAKSLGLKFVSNAKKPLSKGVKEAEKLTGISKENMLMIGDQIFTDVLCGKFSKVKTALVKPMELEPFPFFKFKRALEKIVLKGKNI